MPAQSPYIKRRSARPDSRSAQSRAERLKRLRKMLGPTQAAFCDRFGFSKTQWSNFERCKPLSLEAAQRLCATIPGLSLDWIYSGALGDLSTELARWLGELPDEGNGA